MVPTTSGWPAWPISTISRPGVVVALGLDVDLGDQRAGGVEVEHLAPPRPRPAPPWARRGRRTPPAGRPGTRPAPRRTPRPAPSAARPRGGCGRSRGAHRPARRTSRCARSTIWIARSTPAQKPRGLASSTVSGGGGDVGVHRRKLGARRRVPPAALAPRCRSAVLASIKLAGRPAAALLVGRHAMRRPLILALAAAPSPSSPRPLAAYAQYGGSRPARRPSAQASRTTTPRSAKQRRGVGRCTRPPLPRCATPAPAPS